MKRHSIIVRLNPVDTRKVRVRERASKVTELRFVDGKRRLGHGIGQMLGQLALRGMYPSEIAIDLAILAATVTAADTRISRSADAQDSWTREIDLYVPVAEPERWAANSGLIERILNFLTGDIWRIIFRPRQKGMDTLIDRPSELIGAIFDSVSLFSGGLDSFVGAIDLLEANRNTLFVSHYRDASTKSQETCATRLGKVYGDLSPRHVRANVSFDRNDMADMGVETTTRGRSFIFFALASLAASALGGVTPIHVPENGLISLNVPLDPLRLGAWSTRTTHPFYMARWQNLLDNLELGARLLNPYRFKTKGEMLSACRNKAFLKKTVDVTISCSSIAKARWKGLPPGHCGYCTPCLIRRASIHAAFGNDPTQYSIPDLNARALDARQAESADVRAFKMMGRRLAQAPALAEILVHKTGPLADYSADEIAEYAAVFRRGIVEVSTIVDDVAIEAA
jgi:7-cyano-7-deazaguanine synthase in queuosine biosynthesis